MNSKIPSSPVLEKLPDLSRRVAEKLIGYAREAIRAGQEIRGSMFVLLGNEIVHGDMDLKKNTREMFYKGTAHQVLKCPPDLLMMFTEVWTKTVEGKDPPEYCPPLKGGDPGVGESLVIILWSPDVEGIGYVDIKRTSIGSYTEDPSWMSVEDAGGLLVEDFFDTIRKGRAQHGISEDS